jgi:hypothetical protein
MNTKEKQNQKNKGQKTRHEDGPRKQRRIPIAQHEQERPETRMTR